MTGGGGRDHLSLEAGEEVDEEWMPHGVGHLEDALLGEERLHLVPGDDVSLLQRLDREILPRVLVASQYNLKNLSWSRNNLISVEETL
jgi:hypothetical protein